MNRYLICFLLACFPFIFVAPSYGAQNCYKSRVVHPAPFMGNDGEFFKLEDGTFWQVKYEYEYLYEYYPAVVICPERNVLVVDDKYLQVVAVGSDSGNPSGGTAVIESTIVSDFEGLDYGNIYQLSNGQVWQQTEAWIWIWIWVNPSVVIWQENGQHKMKVEQIDHAVTVQRIR